MKETLQKNRDRGLMAGLPGLRPAPGLQKNVLCDIATRPPAFDFPSAAGGRNQTWRIRLAARDQRSVFSGQLLNQDRELAFNLHSLLGKFFVIAGLEQCQISSQQELVFQFASRTPGDNAEARQFGITFSTA